MAAVAVSSSPAHHYIRTIHTSFTAAHSNPWARSAQPLLNSTHANLPIYASQPLGGAHVQQQQQVPTVGAKYNNNRHPGSPAAAAAAASIHNPSAPASGAGGRRRAYAFRVPSVPTPATTRQGGYKFDPFADEPTSPVPTLSTLASLSVPPTPRLAPASLPSRRAGSPVGMGGGYNHQLHQTHQRRTANVGGYQAHQYHQQHHHQHQQPYRGQGRTAAAPTEVWRSFPGSSSPRSLTYEIEEYDAEHESTIAPVFRARGGNGGLLSAPSPRHRTPSPQMLPSQARGGVSQPALGVSGPAPSRRSPSPPSSSTTLNPASPVFTPSRPLARTPSPPTPAPPPSFASTRTSMLRQDRDAKARLVAGILLNRVHVKKGQHGAMRRRPVVVSEEGKRAYVPSRLRSVVSAAEM